MNVFFFSFLHRNSRSRTVPEINAFYAEIQHGHQKWQESHLCEMSAVHSADTLRVKTFIEIALSRTVPEINALLHFMQKFNLAAKIGGKLIFGKSHQ